MPEIQSPYIQSGPNVGRVADPLVAHTIANTINARADEKFPHGADMGARQRFAVREGNDSAHYQAQETIETERRDELTGLFNKTAYHQDRIALYANKSDNEEIIVARLDLGLLNYFNQVRGHGIGSEYLKQAALLIDGISFQNIQDIYRSCDFARAYRESGDEYVILLKTQKDRAIEIANLLRQAISKNIHNLTIPGGDIAVGDSGNEYKVDKDILLDIGITTATEGRKMLETILDRGSLKRKVIMSALTAETVDRIADARVDIRKAKKRLRMLRTLLLLRDRTLYLQVYSYAAKGALSVDEEQLRDLDSEEKINSWILHIFATRLSNDALRKDDPFQKHLSEELAKATGRFVEED